MSSARFPSPFRQGREAAEQSLHAERARQQSLEEELHAVRRQLEAVRSNLAGTPGATPIHQDTWSRVATPTPTPYGGAQHTPSYQALSRGMNYGAAPTGARKTGVDAYYTARLQKVLGTKADIHNLLDHPGVTIEEAFGAVLAAPSVVAHLSRNITLLLVSLQLVYFSLRCLRPCFAPMSKYFFRVVFRNLLLASALPSGFVLTMGCFGNSFEYVTY